MPENHGKLLEVGHSVCDFNFKLVRTQDDSIADVIYIVSHLYCIPFLLGSCIKPNRILMGWFAGSLVTLTLGRVLFG